MTQGQQQGQLASIRAVEVALRDLDRSVVITGVGLNEVGSIDFILRQLCRTTAAAPLTAPSAPTPTPKPARTREDQDRARGVMRPPRYQGD